METVLPETVAVTLVGGGGTGRTSSTTALDLEPSPRELYADTIKVCTPGVNPV
jgi:hypothetical protein